MQFGRITNIDLKIPPRPPAFAFVHFEDPRDAEEVSWGRKHQEGRGGQAGLGMFWSREKTGRRRDGVRRGGRGRGS